MPAASIRSIRGATRCWASAPGRRSPTLPEVPEHAYIVASDRRHHGGDRGMRAARRAGRHRARQRLQRNRRGRHRARGADRGSCSRIPARGWSARRASAWSICGTRRFSPPTPRSTSPDLPVGRIFAASHSGGMIGTFLSRGKARGIHFAGLVSVGNEVDLSIGEICAATLDDPGIDGYVLFLETMRKAQALRAFALRGGQARQAGAGLQARPFGRGARACGVAHRRARGRGRYRRRCSSPNAASPGSIRWRD